MASGWRGEWSYLHMDADKETLLSNAVVHGFALGLAKLAQGKCEFCFVVTGAGSETQVTGISEESASDQVLEQAEEYTRSLPSPFTVSVIVLVAKGVPIKGKEQDALTAMCYERGAEHGELWAQPLRMNRRKGKYETRGEPRGIGALPNLFSSGQ